MRCIRPPQSQSGTCIFFKTSVCADGYQHLHEKNGINSCYTKSLRNVFWRNFLKQIVWPFTFRVFFNVWKPFFWISIKKTFLVTQILKCLTVGNHPYWTNQQNFVQKILKWKKVHFLCMLIKKNNKPFSQTKFKCVQWTASKHHWIH